MKVFRFMSREEFFKYMNGETLQNKKKHIGKTNSIGFCFLDLEEYKPEEACHFLCGIVSGDICAVFEVEESLLNKTWGIYRKPKEYSEDVMKNTVNLILFPINFTANEYCTTEYSNKDFKLISFALPRWFDFTYSNWRWRDGI